MSEDAVARMRMLKAMTPIEIKCSGTYEELRDYVELTGIGGEWLTWEKIASSFLLTMARRIQFGILVE